MPCVSPKMFTDCGKHKEAKFQHSEGKQVHRTKKKQDIHHQNPGYWVCRGYGYPYPRLYYTKVFGPKIPDLADIQLTNPGFSLPQIKFTVIPAPFPFVSVGCHVLEFSLGCPVFSFSSFNPFGSKLWRCWRWYW